LEGPPRSTKLPSWRRQQQKGRRLIYVRRRQGKKIQRCPFSPSEDTGIERDTVPLQNLPICREGGNRRTVWRGRLPRGAPGLLFQTCRVFGVDQGRSKPGRLPRRNTTKGYDSERLSLQIIRETRPFTLEKASVELGGGRLTPLNRGKGGKIDRVSPSPIGSAPCPEWEATLLLFVGGKESSPSRA